MIFLPRSLTAIARSQWLWWAAALAFLAAPVYGQGFPFVMRVQQGASLVTVGNQGSVALPSAGIGRPSNATLTITYQGAATATISNAPTLNNPDFTASLLSALPVVLAPGASFSVTLQFTPSSSSAESALFSLGYADGSTQGSIQLTLVGATASLTVSYTMPPNQNTVPLASGGTVQFPPTQLNNSVTATIAITNSGAAPGPVTDISIPPGSAFQLVGKPLLPANVNPGASLVFGVKYTATTVTNDTGSLTINLGGTVSTFGLAGSGISSSYSYLMNGTTPITPGPLPFPDTAIGTTSSVFIQVRNTGGAAGVINAIAATGAFAVTDGPPMFPITMNPNDQVTFTLTFAPVLPGKLTGKLTVGNDVFDLSGTGLGPKLTFSYGPGSVTVLNGGLVVLSPTQVGQNTKASFTVTNAGTAVTTITSVALADTRGIFILVSPPTGPVTLNPNDTLTFGIIFQPAVTGFATTTLQIDTQTFTVSGNGTPPPALPNYQFTGGSGNVSPLQQPSIGLSLSAPYSLPLTGTLAISVNSAAFLPDPAVQFATQGKTVTFTIPANTTDAVFPTGGNQIGLQVGSTAGTITITPSFATKSGLDMTPVSPNTVTFTVPASAPQLVRIQVTNVTQAGFVVGVTGLSTTHSLSTLTFQFTPTGNGKPVSYSVPVSAAAGLWFTSAASQNFGGQFSVSVPFAIPSPSVTALSTVNLKSVSVTADNAQGTSGAVSFAIQ